MHVIQQPEQELQGVVLGMVLELRAIPGNSIRVRGDREDKGQEDSPKGSLRRGERRALGAGGWWEPILRRVGSSAGSGVGGQVAPPPSTPFFPSRGGSLCPDPAS